MNEIRLTKGKSVKVDKSDYSFLDQWKWCVVKAGNNYYAVRNSKSGAKYRHLIYMHHIILGFPPKGLEVDHLNRDSLDNRKENLRYIDHRENISNSKRKSKSSRFVGVKWDKNAKAWRAQIQINGTQKHLGLFGFEFLAACAYNEALDKWKKEK